MVARSAQTTAFLRDGLALHLPQTSLCAQCSRRSSARYTIPASNLSYQHHTPRRRHQSTWTATVSAAQTLFSNAKAQSNLPGGVHIDPFRTVAGEMKFLTKNIRQLVGSGHPVLDTVAKYYTQAEGKQIRPMLVLLMSQATAHSPKNPNPLPSTFANIIHVPIDTPMAPPSILNDSNPALPSSLTADSSSTTTTTADLLPTQRRLAEITELIHTASLLHDDVIDNSDSRRNSPSANIAFGNKMAVLAGDFLLGRASVALARLRHPEVTELLATVIANLIEGEFLQLRNTALDEAHPTFDDAQTLNYYLQKTYLKTASLISKSCRAAALLGNADAQTVEAAYGYGKNLGLAFQLVDDMLDFTVSEKELGKPAGADLELGLATAPLLFAWKANPELGELVGRKFGGEGDVRRARQLVKESDGIEQTRALAQDFADQAVHAIKAFPPSDAKTSLEEMCTKVMQRKR